MISQILQLVGAKAPLLKGTSVYCCKTKAERKSKYVGCPFDFAGKAFILKLNLHCFSMELQE
jgi:hypothetical protein